MKTITLAEICILIPFLIFAVVLVLGLTEGVSDVRESLRDVGTMLFAFYFAIKERL
jgi:hypothetical protein